MPWPIKVHRLAEFVAHNPAKARAEGIKMSPVAAAKMASEGIKSPSVDHATKHLNKHYK